MGMERIVGNTIEMRFSLHVCHRANARIQGTPIDSNAKNWKDINPFCADFFKHSWSTAYFCASSDLLGCYVYTILRNFLNKFDFVSYMRSESLYRR